MLYNSKNIIGQLIHQLHLYNNRSKSLHEMIFCNIIVLRGLLQTRNIFYNKGPTML